VASGAGALFFNHGGHDNTATGFNSLFNNDAGSFNIAVGTFAGYYLTGSNNIAIGNNGKARKSGEIRIGTAGLQNATFIAGISGVAVSGSQVVVNSNGKLGVATSSARFKEAIEPMHKTSEAIFALEPVTFRYKKDIDPDGIPQFGLIAEQVEEVDPNLVARDADGKVNTVRYEAVNAMLLNEFLKEHRKVEEQAVTIAQMKASITQQQKQVEILTAGVQKVSDQLELSRQAPRMVVNDQ
jgi:hypothetical protein